MTGRPVDPRRRAALLQQRDRFAAALAEAPDAALVTTAEAYAARARRLQRKLAALDPDQLAAVERVVDAIAAARGHVRGLAATTEEPR